MPDTLTISKSPSLETTVRTLIAGGFWLDGASRNPGYALVYMDRYDEFGTKQNYCFAIFDSDPLPDAIASAQIAAKHKQTNLVIISPVLIPGIASIEWDRFINLFGGPIFSSSVLEPEFVEQINTLGQNQLPAGLIGKPDDLFELYVRNAFEFIFGCRVQRYGQERRFEAVPDGIVLQNINFIALYDTKAYSGGYKVTEDSIRQFASYIAYFRSKYSQYISLNAFIVVSGGFPHEAKILETRSRELQAESGVPLIFMRSETLGQMINLLSKTPSLRRSINWRRVFVNPVVEVDQLESEIRLVQKDKIIPAKSGG